MHVDGSDGQSEDAPVAGVFHTIRTVRDSPRGSFAATTQLNWAGVDVPEQLASWKVASSVSPSASVVGTGFTNLTFFKVVDPLLTMVAS